MPDYNLVDLQQDVREKLELPHLVLAFNDSLDQIYRTRLGYPVDVQWFVGKIRSNHPYKLLDVHYKVGGKLFPAYVTIMENAGQAIGYVSLAPIIPHINGRVGENHALWRYARGPWTDVSVAAEKFLKPNKRMSIYETQGFLKDYLNKSTTARLATFLLEQERLTEQDQIQTLAWTREPISADDVSNLRSGYEPHHQLTVRWLYFTTAKHVVIHKTIACGGNRASYVRSDCRILTV